MSTAVRERRETLEVWVDCRGCNGKGEVEEPHQVITKAAMPHHVAKHAYTFREGTREPIGADCDCPRKTIIIKRVCINCAGHGQTLRKLVVPIPGDKVIVKDQKLLTTIFGEGDEPSAPGVVFDTQEPDEHKMELSTGLGVRVTWDRLTAGVKIPKGQQVELWTFDLAELKIK